MGHGHSHGGSIPSGSAAGRNKSRLAWDRSNRLAGRLLFVTGLAGLIAAPLAPQPLGTFCLIGAVLVVALWSVFESWRVWRGDPDRQPF